MSLTFGLILIAQFLLSLSSLLSFSLFSLTLTFVFNAHTHTHAHIYIRGGGCLGSIVGGEGSRARVFLVLRECF